MWPMQRTASPTGSSWLEDSSKSRSNSRLPSCAPCRPAPRSRGMTASKGGAASANGRAFRSARCSTRARLKPDARYIVFYCADRLGQTGTEADQYYELIGLADAFHAQTILAYEMNDQSSSHPARRAAQAAGGAPARLQNGEICDEHRGRRQPRRHSRWARRVLEDLGYEWYAGI